MSFFSGRNKQPSESGSAKDYPPPASAPAPAGFETVLGASSTLSGDFKSQADVRLDGTFEGTLEIDGNVLVGETAKITADIHAQNVAIAGAVRGNVSGKRVQLLRTGRVWGDITATAIATEEGAFIDGKITMITHDAAQVFDPNLLPLPDELDMEREDIDLDSIPVEGPFEGDDQPVAAEPHADNAESGQ
jgi:cytoskeletal protein CcmA (bactofilin family)